MKLKKLIASVLPGIFLIGYNIGTGSITSMSKSGANFGMDLLWAVLLSCLITYYLIMLFSKYTMVTGETVLQGMKKLFTQMKPYRNRFMFSASCNTAINTPWDTIKYFRDAWLEHRDL